MTVSTPTPVPTSTPTSSNTNYDTSGWTGAMTVTSGTGLGSTASMSFALGTGTSDVYPVSNLSVSTLSGATWTTEIAAISGTTMTLSATGTSTATPNYSGIPCKITLGFSAALSGGTPGTWALIEYQPDGATVNKEWTASLILTKK